MIPEVRACSILSASTSPTGHIERTPEPWGDEWYNSGWEAGGGKMGWVGTNHLVLKGNYSHDNMGPGLWCDINCGHVTVDGNYFP
jgi:hypothetical protein